MKPIKTFIIGSNAFFKNIEGFTPKDIDELNITDEFLFNGNSIHCKGLHGKDVFFFRNVTKEQFIADAKNSKLPMVAGKFLVPEFAKYIGLTIEDLKQFEEIFNKIDKKHSYEKLIYDFYIINNDFKLTEEQLMQVYTEYKYNKNKDEN